MKGRPPLPYGVAKTEVIRARVTQSEHKQVERAAWSSGLSLTAWIRKELIKAAGRNNGKTRRISN